MTTDTIYRAECTQCSRALTSSSDIHAELWASDHEEIAHHRVDITELEEPL